jgi:hypothetical protein
MAWRNLGKAVEDLEHGIEREIGEELLTVGMDTNVLASVLAFYDPDGDGAVESAGSSLFDRRGLMYSHWFPKRDQTGRSLLLVGWEADDLDRPMISERAERLGPISELKVTKDGVVVGSVFVRQLHGYHAEAPGR